jgi:hypothetical protein
MKEKYYKQCQSCGMPLKMDKKGGGIEADGAKSCVYCSSCYVGGKFYNPEMTMEQMQEFVDKILREEMKASKLFRWMAKKQIPRLKRWRI